jgi:glycosyltransferase involved in cell wall biosynthesis
MTGVEELSRNGELKNSYEFYGEISADRNKATGELRVVRSFRLSIIKFLTKAGLKPFLSKKIRDSKKKINGSDLVVFQGFQETHLARYARKIHRRLAYMPHSPSVIADEYKMLCELNSHKFDEKHYQTLLGGEAALIGLSDFVVFPSRGAGTSYIEKFPKALSGKNIVYIKSGVKVDCGDVGRDSARENKGPIRILFAGRYVSHKGYDLFCDAAELIGENIDGIEFVTLGDGPMKKSCRYVTDLGWRNDVFNVLETADIVVIPNRIAYYDLLPLECAAFGKPLVMTKVGGNVDQMHDLPDSLSCDSATPEQLAESIKAAITKLKLDPTWGSKNRLAFESTFTVKKFAERWDAAVENMVSSN